MPGHGYDLAVIGAGIVGLAVAREFLLRRPGARVVVVDRERSVGQHQTGHNSGVIHSGIYYAPGSLKARLCVEGARLMYAYCEQHQIPHDRCGKLIVAISEDELPRLADLEARGRANGVPGLRRLTAAQIREVEPGARGVAALHSPATGIVDYGAVAAMMERELRDAGADFALGREVTAVRRDRGRTVLATSAGPVAAAWAIGCAGLWADRLAVRAGAPGDPRIVPFRGAYLRLAPGQDQVVRGMIYPVPDPDLPFLGVHITRRIDGSVLLGPTALLVAARDGYRPWPGSAAAVPRLLGDLRETLAWPGTWGVARRFWRTGISEVRLAASRRAFIRACARYLPGLSAATIAPGTVAGVRAQAVARDGRLVDDFVISDTPGATHVRNAPSPAATSSLALAREIVDRAERAGLRG
jgi:L-2-hydroxyglutarate oxidase LhgO